MNSPITRIRSLLFVIVMTSEGVFGAEARMSVTLYGDGSSPIYQSAVGTDVRNPYPPSADIDAEFVLQPNVRYSLQIFGLANSQLNLLTSAGARATLDLSLSFGPGASLPTGLNSNLGVTTYGFGSPNDSKNETFLSIPFSRTFSTSLTRDPGTGQLGRGFASGTSSAVISGQSVLFNGILTADSVNKGPQSDSSLSTTLNFWVNQSTSLRLSGRIAATTRGSTQDFPTLPDFGTGGFTNASSGDWVDPPLASGFDFAMTGPSLFTGILAFPSGIDADDQFEVWTGNTSLGVFSVGQTVSFGAGVTSFRVTGINPSVDGTSPTAFPIRLAFNTTTASFTMTPRYDPGQAYLSSVVIVPATADQPPRFSGLVLAVPPSGIVRLQASTDLGLDDPWADIASAPLDGSGSNTFTDIVDNRPQAIGAKNIFFRAVTESTSEP